MAGPTFRRVRRSSGPAQRSLTAASQPIPDPTIKQYKNPISLAGRMGWQTEAWELLDRVGELRYYVAWRSNSCSKVRLVASELDEEGVPTGKCRSPVVRNIVKSIGGNQLGAGQFIKRNVEGLTVPGEVFAGIIVGPDGRERWLAFSRDEVRKTANKTTVKLPNGQDHILNADDSLWRIWNPHPRIANESDSPVRSS